MTWNDHGNLGRNWRHTRDCIAEMLVKRLDILSLADRAQVHGNATGSDCKFFGLVHEFASETFSLTCWINAEKAEVHAIAAFFEIDAAHKRIILLEQEKLAGAEVFQRAFVVDAVAADERTLHLKRTVNEPPERVRVRILGDSKRNCDSC